MGPEAFSLAKKHVVVVGASSGLGRAAASRCAEMGARVSICARREEKLREVLSELSGEAHGCCRLDVKNIEDIERAFDEFVSERGPIHGMVYSAGINVIRPLNVLDAELLDKMYEINLRGAILCCQAATKNTRASSDAMSLVLISSAGAQFPAGSGMTCYAATKAGINGVVKALAYELARRKIRVNAVAPAAVATDLWTDASMTEAQKQAIYDTHLLGVGSVDDVAYACVYLLSPAAKWVTGTVMTVDGGYSIC